MSSPIATHASFSFAANADTPPGNFKTAAVPLLVNSPMSVPMKMSVLLAARWETLAFAGNQERGSN